MAVSYTSDTLCTFDPSLRKATVRGASALPEELWAYADEIEILDASYGTMRSLPASISQFSNLRIAFFSYHQFETIPDVLAACPRLEMVGFKSCSIRSFSARSLPLQLKGLILTDNQLSDLPEDIGRLQNLRKLMLTGNRLTGLPRQLLDCTALELLRLSINHLAASPDWLFDLPRLAWYSDGHNPFRENMPAPAATPVTIPWEELTIGHIIGESSKNIVYRAKWQTTPVAVKLFGTGVTTDGTPGDDLAMSLQAGNHPQLIGSIGRVQGAPDGRDGLVMPLIPETYEQLALPPDFTSLTRDLFVPGTSFRADYIHRVAEDVAQALLHLSQRGIMHGDIYAHNILSRSDGASYLGDFGASSSFIPDTADARRRERIEVRGYGCLLDDLLPHTEHPSAALQTLRDACLSAIPAERPLYTEIIAALANG